MIRNLQENEKARRIYVPSKPCELCGQPTNSISIRCDRCLESLHLVDKLAVMRDWLRENPREPIEISRDRRGVPHLVFALEPNLAWCGARAAQLHKNRQTTIAGIFPLALCEVCLAAFESMGV